MPRLSPLPKNKPIDPNARKADKANAIHRLPTKSIRVLSGISLIVFMPRSPSSSAISECGPSNFHHLRPHPPEVGDHHVARRSEEHTSELQSLMRISYAVYCLKNKN